MGLERDTCFVVPVAWLCVGCVLLDSLRECRCIVHIKLTCFLYRGMRAVRRIFVHTCFALLTMEGVNKFGDGGGRVRVPAPFHVWISLYASTITSISRSIDTHRIISPREGTKQDTVYTRTLSTITAYTISQHKVVIYFLENSLLYWFDTGAKRRDCSRFHFSTSRSIIQPQILTPPFALRVQVRLLAQTDSPLPRPRAQPSIIKSGSMIHTSIVPNSQVVWVLPTVSNLQVMVFRDELHEPI